MKSRITLSSLLVASTLFLVHCGNQGGDKTSTIFGLDTTSPFRVLAFDPGYQAENVERSTEIRFLLSMPIDTSSILDSIVVKQQVSGGALTDFTGNLSTRGTSIADDTLVFTPSSGLLGSSATYYVTLNSTLKSKSGLNISSFSYRFSTGTFNPLGSGILSAPGAPQVVRMDLLRYPAPGVCLGVLYQTNESLADAPNVRFEYKDITSMVYSSGYMDVRPYQTNDGSTWALLFPDDGCGAVNGAWRIKVETVRAQDTDGDFMVLDGTTRREYKKESGQY